jgi:hypothetical protein
MTKEEIRSLVKNSLQKYDKTARYHDRVLDAVIEKVLSLFYHYIFVIDPLSIQRYTKRYGDAVLYAITYNASSDYYYMSYPETVIPLPDKASGVRRIDTRSGSHVIFYPMDIREVDLVRNGSYFNTVTQKVGYVVTQDRIEFYNMTAAMAAVGVVLDLLIPFSKYSDTDVVLIPEITDSEGNNFLDVVVKELGTIPPVDLADTNADIKEK